LTDVEMTPKNESEGSGREQPSYMMTFSKCLPAVNQIRIPLRAWNVVLCSYRPWKGPIRVQTIPSNL